MLPNTFNDELQSEFETVVQPSKTFGLRLDGTRVFGTVDEVEALTQSIYIMLSVERYEYPIYSWDYFFETTDLFGKDPEYVAAEIPRRITETLLQDDRILGTRNFTVDIRKRNVSVRYTADTIYGNIELNQEVNL